VTAPPYAVAVTGGIGSGKTFVCNLFAARHGVPVIDADVIAREVVEPGEPGLAAIVSAFGPDVLDANGRLDRARVRALVFADEARRRQLEDILHPQIRARMRAQALAVTTPYCLLSIPLLAEGGHRDGIDRVLVVDCPESLQIRRVQARDHLTEPEVIAIMSTQASRAARLRIADDVIVNDGDDAALTAQVDALHVKYLDLAAREA
jgi:dephospho-CoA kinase